MQHDVAERECVTIAESHRDVARGPGSYPRNLRQIARQIVGGSAGTEVERAARDALREGEQRGSTRRGHAERAEIDGEHLAGRREAMREAEVVGTDDTR